MKHEIHEWLSHQPRSRRKSSAFEPHLADVVQILAAGGTVYQALQWILAHDGSSFDGKDELEVEKQLRKYLRRRLKGPKDGATSEIVNAAKRMVEQGEISNGRVTVEQKMEDDDHSSAALEPGEDSGEAIEASGPWEDMDIPFARMLEEEDSRDPFIGEEAGDSVLEAEILDDDGANEANAALEGIEELWTGPTSAFLQKEEEEVAALEPHADQNATSEATEPTEEQIRDVEKKREKVKRDRTGGMVVLQKPVAPSVEDLF